MQRSPPSLNSTRPPRPTTGSPCLPGRRSSWTWCTRRVRRHRPPPAGLDHAGAGRQPERGGALERPPGLAQHLPGAGVGRAGGRRGVRPRSGAADGPPTGRLGISARSGGNDGGGRRTGERRPRGTSCRRVAGQPPGRPPDPPRPAAPPAGAAGGTGCCRVATPLPWRSTSRSTSTAARPWHATGCGCPPQPLPLVARQFKAATGLPPHQYVILRRVERAKQLLQAGTDLSLAQVASRVGFSDQSQFSRHFKAASLASRRGSSGCPQESLNSQQFPPRSVRAIPLPFLMSKAGWRRRPGGR